MRVKAYTMTILFFVSILSIGIIGAFIEEPKSHELVENPIQYEVQGQSHPSGFQRGHANQNVTLSLGATHGCAILENNTMTCWGETWDGALGCMTVLLIQDSILTTIQFGRLRGLKME